MAGWLFLTFALLGAGLVANAAWPRRGPILLVPSWLAALLTIDLAPHHLAAQALVVGWCVGVGALETLPGKLALVTAGASALGLIVIWLPSLAAAAAVSACARELGLDAAAPVPRSLLLTPFLRERRSVAVTRDVAYFRAAGRVLTLDIYRGPQAAARRPALVYFHGGAWMVGDKRAQGLPLCHHLAALGWVCLNANHRLSPGATYPDHVVDAKAAIAWARAHANEYGIDPAFIAVAGGSSGAHIAAMTALTPGDRALQPGFEERDASVQAVVTSYGVYDLTNRLGVHNPQFFTRLIGPLVIKAFPDTEPERFRAASPRDRIIPTNTPWLIIHGAADTLAPAVEARDFAAALAARSSAPVGYAELPGALHGFDVCYSLRGIAAVELTARFLITMYRRTREVRDARP